jgi:hypothetical protein
VNFQKLFGLLTKSRKNVFDDIIGPEYIKRLFGLALRSDEPAHILLSGPPASAETIFLLSSRQNLKNSYFVDGGNAMQELSIIYSRDSRPIFL